ncbi:DUF3180 domain-containing protein [Alloscardovia omnicolens]|uniref:DUF3180 domain-containing protein n=1 Tax=Alloscardovia omnicolens TaxID=419015 RepID=UPI003A6600BD
MKARRTPWWYYPLIAFVGFLVGLIVSTLMSRHASAMVSAPWYLSASILAVGLVVAWSAWQVHQFAEGKISKMPPERSVNTLIMAQAVGRTAAALVGWYLGIFVIVIHHADVAYFATVSWETALAAIACLIDVGLGIVSEIWCLMPPTGEEKEQ